MAPDFGINSNWFGMSLDIGILEFPSHSNMKPRLTIFGLHNGKYTSLKRILLKVVGNLPRSGNL